VKGNPASHRPVWCGCTPNAFTGDAFRLAPLRLGRPQLEAACALIEAAGEGVWSISARKGEASA